MNSSTSKGEILTFLIYGEAEEGGGKVNNNSRLNQSDLQLIGSMHGDIHGFNIQISREGHVSNKNKL